MSEQRETLGMSTGEEGKESQEQEEQEEQQELQTTAAEDEARSHGWVSLEEWQEEGKDASEWSNYGAFNKNGSLFRRINDLEANDETHEMRLKNLNQAHQIQMNSVVEELNRQKQDAIKDGDVATVNKLDKQIDETKASSPDGVAPNLLIAQWNEKNSWIFDETTVKSKFAKNAFEIAMSQHSGNVEKAITIVEAKVAERFPDEQKVNERRSDPSKTGGKTGSSKGKGVTLASATPTEQYMLDRMPLLTEEEKLQVLKDGRVGDE